MQKASSKAYVSIRKLKKYQEERDKQQQRDVQMSVIKEEAEESNPDIEPKMADGDGEERKQVMEVGELMAYHSDHSAEGVDSDDFDDDIKDPALLIA
jgi:hypothetical protein